jgi:hypothetical protein
MNGNWTVDQCLVNTKSTTWGTGFVINTNTCTIFADGCSKAPSSNSKYYRVTTENTPVTIGELSSLTKRVEDLMHAASTNSKANFSKVQKEIQEVND